MGLNPANDRILEQLALKGLTHVIDKRIREHIMNVDLVAVSSGN